VKKIFLHGRVNKSLQNFYSNSFIFVLVSRLEGYGMVYAEAMQFGLPIVGSLSGAVPELVEHERNGFLCDPEIPEQIAQAIALNMDIFFTRKFQTIIWTTSLFTVKQTT